MKIYYDKKELEIKEGTKVIDYFAKEIEKTNALACRFNNEIKSLDYKIDKDGEISFIDFNDVDGKRIYNRGIIYIMSKAINELYKNALITVNYQLSNAMFCEIDNMEITKEMIENIKQKMIEITNKNLPITKVTMTTEEAEEFYEKERSLKGRVQLDSKQKDGVSLYYCEDYYNYFYGVMPISTGIVKTYDIKKYKDGFLVRFPSKTNQNVLSEYVENKKLFTTLNEYEDLHRILNINTLYKLNKIVREDKITEHILLAEALHEKKIAQIADDIATKNKVKMILIAGPSSSGKTTFAQRLGLQLRLLGLRPVTISVDNYFVEREQTPKDSNGNYDFECLEAIDLELFNKHLKKLLQGREIKVPTFDFAHGTKVYDGKTMRLRKDDVLVIEGIHCLNDKLTVSIPKEQKYKVYISALTVLNIDYYNRISTTDTRLIRRIVRDNQFRNYKALHTLEMWYSVNRGENKYIYPFQEEADVMFNTSLIYELGVLKDYAIPLLKEIDNTHREYSEAKRLIRLLSYFESIPTKAIPETSLLREFIGGSIFH